MTPSSHGGDLRRMATLAGVAPDDLIDFSVNVRPEGPPDFILAALTRALNKLAAYPSPRAEEAVEAAAKRFDLSPEHIVLGNGSNELIHALPRVLKERGIETALIIEPAFSEYALACRGAGVPCHPFSACASDGFCVKPDKLSEELRKRTEKTAVFLANPGNPSGSLLPAERLALLIKQHPSIVWIIDEAFIEYAGEEESIISLTAHRENIIVLRSLTKFHAVPGVRMGFAAASPVWAEALKNALPAWTVNAFALEAALAVFEDRSDFAETTRRANDEAREKLAASLARVPGVTVYPSRANYLLFHWENAPQNLYELLLRRRGIALRDCRNYAGLSSGKWFRAAVRSEEDNTLLAEALRELAAELAEGTKPSCLISAPHLSRRRGIRPALMLQGTSSGAGKSILVSAYARILRQDGYDVAPFKAQNMALNSGVTFAGEEIGRAQIVQAQACRLDPDARMNPVLLKPHSDTGSQVIVLGKAVGHMRVKEYFRAKKDLWQTVREAYDSLASEHELMVIEGAGSPGEINLKSADIVNMAMARHARASVLLAGDIDRGGLYASFLGSWMTFSPEERNLLAGFLVNRFRGDSSLLGPAHDYLKRHTGVPVLGVVPYIRNLNIPEEDMACFSFDTEADDSLDCLDVAVVMLRHVSNYTDLAPLAMEPDVRLRPVRSAAEWGAPDLVILPGSKSVVADLEELERSGLADKIRDHAERGKWLFGICGGLQILGRRIIDPHAVESDASSFDGLGVLDLETTFEREKILSRVNRASTPLAVPSGGYEIHHGVTRAGESAEPLFLREDASACGYVTGRAWCTYLHGAFDDDLFRRAYLDHLRKDLGKTPQGRVLVSYDLETALDRLADIVRESSDMNAIYSSLGLK